MSRRLCRLLGIALLLISTPAAAVDSVGVWGNYYKERSTRVIEPFLRVTKDLPYDIGLEAAYLVDTITSASTGFTGSAEDELFNEFRHEVRFAARVKLFNFITPGASIRYSTEPDYKSLTYGFDLSVDLFEERTNVKAYFRGQDDDIGSVADETFEQDLDTYVVGASWTQIFRKDLVAGLALETQIARGFQHNEYRANEVHPLERDRFSASIWASYAVAQTNTVPRLEYRFYWDSWDILANTIDLTVSQEAIAGHLDVIPRYRFYHQSGAYFSQAEAEAGGLQTVPDRADGRRLLQTRDPKVEPFHSHMIGLQIRWTLRVLRGTFLELFEASRIEPYYAYVSPSEGYRYGGAHLAQLGWYWEY